MEKDSESGKSRRVENGGTVGTEDKHERELQALNDPDAHLSEEERAQIVRIAPNGNSALC